MSATQTLHRPGPRFLTLFATSVFATSAVAQQWRQLSPQTSPQARSYHAMAYGSHTGHTLVFGGFKYWATLGDTWRWDGSEWASLELLHRPPSRGKAAMVYDKKRREYVLFGGLDPWNQDLGDTWTFDGREWRLAAGANDGPGVRRGHCLVYDEVREAVLLFGGARGAGVGETLGDLWEWDGVQWVEVAPAGTTPQSRTLASMVFNPRTGRVFLHGGWPITTGNYEETWEFDSATDSWCQCIIENPPERNSAAMVFDRQRKSIVLFGGHNITSALGDQWEFHDGAWKEIEPIGKPAARNGHKMIYDRKRKLSMMFGGNPANSAAHFGDTQVFFTAIPRYRALGTRDCPDAPTMELRGRRYNQRLVADRGHRAGDPPPILLIDLGDTSVGADLGSGFARLGCGLELIGMITIAGQTRARRSVFHLELPPSLQHTDLALRLQAILPDRDAAEGWVPSELGELRFEQPEPHRRRER